MGKILIETQECDYMQYFEIAGALVEKSLEGYRMEVSLATIVDSFIYFTKGCIVAINGDIDEHTLSYLDSLRNDFIILIDKDIPNDYDGNGSHVIIEFTESITLTGATNE